MFEDLTHNFFLETGARSGKLRVEIAEIATRLREAAGLSREPSGVVANQPEGLMAKVADKLTP